MIPFRYFIYALSTTCVAFVYALRLAFHSTILCQYNINDTDHYLSDPLLRGWSFSSVSLGLLLGLAPLPLMHSWGTRNVVMTYGLLGSLASFAYPWSDSHGFLPSFIIRTIQGAPGAMLLWLVNNVSLEWAPRNEVGLAIAILSSIYQLSPVVAMVTAGEMCSTIGWQYTYYVLSIVTLILFTVFFCVYTNDVTKNRFVSKSEMALITDGKREHTKKQSKLPWRLILRDSQVWLVWFMYFSFFVGMYVFLQYGPTYINQVLGLDVRSTGYAGALPHLLSLALKFIYGPMLDRCCSLSLRTRLTTAFAMVETISALCLGLLIFTTSSTVGLAVYILFNSLHGLVIVVIMKQIQIIARQHSHFLANGNTFIVAVCILSIPTVVNVVVPENTHKQWSTLFSGVAVLMMTSVVAFSVYGRCSPSKWTEIEAV